MDDLQRAWLDWVESPDIQWDWFCTLTFLRKTNATEAQKAWTWWVRKITKAALGLSSTQAKKEDLPWILAIEEHEKSGYHLHALVAGVEHLDKKEFLNLWRKKHGSQSRVEACRSGRDAALYSLKGASKDTQVMISRALKRPSAQ